MKDSRLHNALIDSLRLSSDGKRQEALRLMEEAIVEAMKEGDDSSLDVLLNQVAILVGDSNRESPILSRYYEQYLTYSPENPRALYGLADIEMKAGHTESAVRHAKRCYEALLKAADQKVRDALLDLVLERWPEVGR